MHMSSIKHFVFIVPGYFVYIRSSECPTFYKLHDYETITKGLQLNFEAESRVRVLIYKWVPLWKIHIPNIVLEVVMHAIG